MLAFLLLSVSLVDNVRALISINNLPAAERSARNYQKQMGTTPEFAAALSWIARGNFELRQLDQAEKVASETHDLSVQLLKGRRLDQDPLLQTALGASIEVRAQVLAGRGERAEAVGYLRQELVAYGNSPIGERIRKNLNLLNMEGKPAPPIDISQSMGVKPASLAALKGKAVLLFFWAHWCSDCKGEGPIIADLLKTYGPKGLVALAPTRLYGYVAGGVDAAPVTEKKYIEQIRQQYYPALANVAVPFGESNFLQYGASTTPTVVLIDRAGIVRFYHPGAVSEQELATQIQKVLGK